MFHLALPCSIAGASFFVPEAPRARLLSVAAQYILPHLGSPSPLRVQFEPYSMCYVYTNFVTLHAATVDIASDLRGLQPVYHIYIYVC